MRKTDFEKLKKKYFSLDAIILVLVFVLITAFYPMKFFVQWLLPNYTESLKYFFILAPGIALTSAISVIKHNFLINGLASLAILIVIMVGTYFLVSRSVIVITVVTVISQLIWFFN